MYTILISLEPWHDSVVRVVIMVSIVFELGT